VPSCELCGRSMKGRGRNVRIEGAMMLLCPQCAHKFGDSPPSLSNKTKTSGSRRQPIWTSSTSKTSPPSHHSIHVRSKPKPKHGGLLIEDMMLIENYAEVIRAARQKKKLSQDELAQKVGERISTLQSIEAGRLKPTRKTLRGLERELEISLLEPITTAPIKTGQSKSVGGPTLGDVVKVKRKKSQKANE
jgi:putative transcription factor